MRVSCCLQAETYITSRKDIIKVFCENRTVKLKLIITKAQLNPNAITKNPCTANPPPITAIPMPPLQIPIKIKIIPRIFFILKNNKHKRN